MNFDAHNYRKKLQTKLSAIRKAKIRPTDKKDVFAYYDDMVARGISVPRLEKVMHHLHFLALMTKKPIRSLDRQGIVSLVRDIEMRETWSASTKRDYRSVLKTFYRWLKGADDYPAEVKWIKTTMPGNGKLPEDLLTEEEVGRMIEAATSPRDKAIVSMLYESGCRVGEILDMRVKDVQPARHGFMARVSGKTGERRVLLVFSASFIGMWLNAHPLRENPDAPLWVTRFNKFCDPKKHWKTAHGDTYCPLDYPGVSLVLRTQARRCGIKKRVNPHNFRHSRATFLASRLTEQQLKHYMGWSQSSNMTARYVHMSGRDVDGALLGMYGLSQEEKPADQLKVAGCPRCKEQNDSTSKFCCRCGSPMEVKDSSPEDLAIRIDRLLDSILEDGRLRSVIQKKIP